MKKKFEMNNVYIGSYMHCRKYGDEYRFPKELEKELAPYVENGYLKTDIKSLAEVSGILDRWTGQMVSVNSDQTITFYDANY